MLKINRIWEMPNRYTFKMKAVSSLLSDHVLAGQTWADPFSGMFSPASLTNDADLESPALFHEDGLEWLKDFQDNSVDGVLFDPPYSVEQALRAYKSKYAGTAGRTEYQSKCKNEIARIVKSGGKAICFAWNTAGVGKTRGFELIQVLDICHGGDHNDTLITVEVKKCQR
jgi:hypothetical protein